jgi:hypothetical protein
MHKVSPEDALDLEIGYIKLNSNDRLSLFNDTSSINSVKNLQVFALFGLSDRELADGLTMPKITKDRRQVLVRELARRYILSRRFKELAQLLDTEKVSIFSPMITHIKKLAENPEDINALVAMGEFLYEQYLTPYAFFSDTNFSQWASYPFTDLELKCEPCQNWDERTATYTAPIWFFQSAVKSAMRSKKKSELEAKALHYIVMGGKVGYHESRCTWDNTGIIDSTFLTDQEAFTRLHKLYKNSEWAKKTPYYYQ